MTRAEQRVLARKRQYMVVAMRDRGMSLAQIAEALAVSRWSVRNILQADYREPSAAAHRPPARPSWTYPDDDLLRLAAAVRAEIVEAEGFERPML